MVSRIDIAPAKINLTLHVTGQNDQGYHLLDSLVMFALDAYDSIYYDREKTGFKVSGPLAAGIPETEDNLCCQARAFCNASGYIELEKHLPAQAGIGGGSADAAAVIRLCQTKPVQAKALAALGADVPVCYQSISARMEGVGEKITPLQGCDPLHAVLVNDGSKVSTPEVFAQLIQKENAPMNAMPPAKATDLIRWLQEQRNDLEAPAICLAPQISKCLKGIAASPHNLLARMSGSGSTCFGLYLTAEHAQHAAQWLQNQMPAAWVRRTRLGNAPVIRA